MSFTGVVLSPKIGLAMATSLWGPCGWWAANASTLLYVASPGTDSRASV